MVLIKSLVYRPDSWPEDFWNEVLGKLTDKCLERSAGGLVTGLWSEDGGMQFCNSVFCDSRTLFPLEEHYKGACILAHGLSILLKPE
jgi:hypothetical protein